MGCFCFHCSKYPCRIFLVPDKKSIVYLLYIDFWWHQHLASPINSPVIALCEWVLSLSDHQKNYIDSYFLQQWIPLWVACSVSPSTFILNVETVQLSIWNILYQKPMRCFDRLLWEYYVSCTSSDFLSLRNSIIFLYNTMIYIIALLVLLDMFPAT